MKNIETEAIQQFVEAYESPRRFGNEELKNLLSQNVIDLQNEIISLIRLNERNQHRVDNLQRYIQIHEDKMLR